MHFNCKKEYFILKWRISLFHTVCEIKHTNIAVMLQSASMLPCSKCIYPDKLLIFYLPSGWKGTLMGVATATVEAMVTEFGCQVSNIIVAVGPSVGACCFTLGRQQALDFHRIHPNCVSDLQSARPHVNIRLANRYSWAEYNIIYDIIYSLP